MNIDWNLIEEKYQKIFTKLKNIYYKRNDYYSSIVLNKSGFFIYVNNNEIHIELDFSLTYALLEHFFYDNGLVILPLYNEGTESFGYELFQGHCYRKRVKKLKWGRDEAKLNSIYEAFEILNR